MNLADRLAAVTYLGGNILLFFLQTSLCLCFSVPVSCCLPSSVVLLSKISRVDLHALLCEKKPMCRRFDRAMDQDGDEARLAGWNESRSEEEAKRARGSKVVETDCGVHKEVPRVYARPRKGEPRRQHASVLQQNVTVRRRGFTVADALFSFTTYTFENNKRLRSIKNFDSTTNEPNKTKQCRR
jgi:hypothetical protein